VESGSHTVQHTRVRCNKAMELRANDGLKTENGTAKQLSFCRTDNKQGYKIFATATIVVVPRVLFERRRCQLSAIQTPNPHAAWSRPKADNRRGEGWIRKDPTNQKTTLIFETCVFGYCTNSTVAVMSHRILSCSSDAQLQYRINTWIQRRCAVQYLVLGICLNDSKL
jgi:hypothetical protein